MQQKSAPGRDVAAVVNDRRDLHGSCGTGGRAGPGSELQHARAVEPRQISEEVVQLHAPSLSALRRVAGQGTGRGRNGTVAAPVRARSPTGAGRPAHTARAARARSRRWDRSHRSGRLPPAGTVGGCDRGRAAPPRHAAAAAARAAVAAAAAATAGSVQVVPDAAADVRAALYCVSAGSSGATASWVSANCITSANTGAAAVPP